MVAKSDNPEETAPDNDKKKEAEEENKELNELEKGDERQEEYNPNEKVRLLTESPPQQSQQPPYTTITPQALQPTATPFSTTNSITTTATATPYMTITPQAPQPTATPFSTTNSTTTTTAATATTATSALL